MTAPGLQHEAKRMANMQERWEEPRCAPGVPPRVVGNDGSLRPSASTDSPSPPPLSPLNLNTVLTVEDLRRLMKIVAYS
ncbi:MAG: hypothetical protein HQL91_13105 [Magnetococcales bacterium]|nr:hypothetical protein [Magnetococcales bacterium]